MEGTAEYKVFIHPVNIYWCLLYARNFAGHWGCRDEVPGLLELSVSGRDTTY